MMPEGLANNMTVQDFRDLIGYVMANPFLTEVSVAGPLPECESPPAVAPWKQPPVGSDGPHPAPLRQGPCGCVRPRRGDGPRGDEDAPAPGDCPPRCACG